VFSSKGYITNYTGQRSLTPCWEVKQ